MKKISTISEYINDQPKEVADRLKVINNIVKKISPKAVGSIAYGMAAYKLDGKPLLYFAGFKKHIGLYPFPDTLSVFKKETEKYKTAKGSIQFQHDEKLPVALITKIIRFRVNANTKKVCSRGHEFYGAGPCPKCWPGRLKK